MKKAISVFMGILLFFGLAACGADDQKQQSEQTSEESRKADNQEIPSQVEQSGSQNEGSHILIAYFSIPEDEDFSGVDAVAGASIVVTDGEKTGNTEYVAELIQDTTGGDLFRIETVDNYPLDHDTLVDQAAEEQDENLRPELAGHIENFDSYNTIILGFPNWWGDLPMPVYSFLEEYDFGAKTIIPFVTHGGSGFSDTLSTISDLQPGAFISENTLSLSRNDVAGCEEEVKKWAESLGLNVREDMQEDGSDTVAGAVADPNRPQTLYLWEEGNVPATTEYTENDGNYFDGPDFRPFMAGSV